MCACVCFRLFVFVYLHVATSLFPRIHLHVQLGDVRNVVACLNISMAKPPAGVERALTVRGATTHSTSNVTTVHLLMRLTQHEACRCAMDTKKCIFHFGGRCSTHRYTTGIRRLFRDQRRHHTNGNAATIRIDKEKVYKCMRTNMHIHSCQELVT